MLRKAALLTHVVFSVGWLGAVSVFLALAIVGLTSQDHTVVRSAYVVMAPAARYALLPLAFGTLVSGLVMSLGTHWGLFRHYWVIVKLVLTVASTAILIFYMRTFNAMAVAAADLSSEIAAVRNPSPLLHASVALAVLIAATFLAVFKPRGMTRYGWRVTQ